MKVVAIDYGLKRMGLAISNMEKTIALPWKTVTGGKIKVLEELQKKKEEIEKVVIGLPLLMSGEKGEMALLVEAFGKELENELQIPVQFLDERLTSKQADSALRETGNKRKRRDEKSDEMAALILLQMFFTLEETKKVQPQL